MSGLSGGRLSCGHGCRISVVIVQAKTMESLFGEDGRKYLRDEVGQAI